MLADPDGKIVDLYGVRMDHLDMAHRVSFLIGLDGKIVHITDAGNPAVHFEQMEAAIAALKIEVRPAVKSLFHPPRAF